MGYKKVSIVILTWNKLEFTKRCLQYLEKNTNYPRWELIIVDNGSTDGTRDFLKHLKKVSEKKYRIIFNRLNLGYAKGVNQGIREAKGEYVLLLNNDVYVLKNWLKKMVELLERDQKNMIVGAKLIYPKTRRIQHAGIVFVRQIEHLHINKNSSLNNPAVNQVRYLDAVTGACMLIRQQLFNEIGFFDEQYRYGGFEDVDFCLRTRIRGFKILYSPLSLALHEEKITTAQLRNYTLISKHNYKIFQKKWKKILNRYNDDSLHILFRLKMYLIYGLFKLVPKNLELLIKKWLTSILEVS